MKRVFLILIFLICGLGYSCVDVGPVTEEYPITNHVKDWRDEVIYQVLIDRFADGDVNNNYNVDLRSMGAWHGGDYQGVIDKIPYLKELGVTAVWISPVVKNVEEDAGVAGYHGYWTQDFVSVNPHFGDLVKLREMISALHDAGILVIQDIVTNHIGQLFYYDINRNNQPDEAIYGSGRDDSPLFRVTEWDPDYDSNGIKSFTSLGESGLAPLVWVYMPGINRVPPNPPEFKNENWYNRRGRVTNWNDGEQVVKGDFPGGLKDLKTTNPEVRDALIKVFQYWIGTLNIDGFRIDTLKHIEHGFWQEFCPAMRSYAADIGKENFFMFGEAFDGSDDLLSSFTYNGEVDSVFYFSQKFQVFDGVFKYNNPTKDIENLFNTREEKYNAQPHEGGVTSSDGTGIASRDMLVNFIDNHDLPRFLYDKKDPKALRNALFFLLTEDGIPCIYYGTEQGFKGGNDPANREDMWDSDFDTSGKTFKHVKHLIELRKKYVALRRGQLNVKWSTERNGSEQDAGIFAFERVYGDKKALVVINVNENKSSETSATDAGGGDMQTSFAGGTALVNVFEDDDPTDSVTVAADGTLSVSIPARGGKIFVPKDQAIE